MKRIVKFFTLTLCVILATQCSVSKNVQNSKPVIGISTRYSSEDRIYIGDNYCVSIRKAGGIPVLLPHVKDSQMADELIRQIDGLVMTGGEDVDPAYYSEEPLNETVHVNGRRDTSDFFLLEAARKKVIPVLGICRGEQIVNVFYGGSLYQDIPSQIESEIVHNQKDPSYVGTHMAYITEGTEFRKLIGADSLLVNTFHHQAVKQIASPFVVSARTADGIVEAFETSPECLKDKNSSIAPIICTQFHPEGFVSNGNDAFLPIFQYFVDCAAKNRR